MFISLKRSLIIIITYSETYELSNLFLLDIDRNVIPLVCLFSGYIYFIILKIFIVLRILIFRIVIFPSDILFGYRV